jgi:sugar lactone lactonase YvrE
MRPFTFTFAFSFSFAFALAFSFAGCTKPAVAVAHPIDEAAILAKMRAERTRKIGTATVAFTLDDPDLLVEGLAYDAATGDFFVSSVHQRKILRVGKDGRARDFVSSGQDGLCGTLGLAIDPRRRSLWATSSCLPEAAGLRADERGKTGVFELDLATGALKVKIELAQPGHHFNDLIIDADGRLFLADAKGGLIYTVEAGGPLEPWLPPGMLVSPQGLALTPDGKSLYVADYAKGLARIDRATRAVTWLVADDAILKTLDGLQRDADGSLIATQNGIAPPRVVRIRVDGDRARVETLLMNAPGLEEPTLGAIVGPDFVFVGAAQWDAFAPDKPAPRHATPVYRLRLH